MKILVLVKEVPDTYGERKLDLETGLADREASETIIDEISERALEVAVNHADENEDVEVVALSVAAEDAQTSIRKALAIGAQRAIHVIDESLVGADIGLTAEVLAAAIRREGPDLVLAGQSSTDGASGLVPPAIAELLDLPLLGEMDTLAIAEETVSGRRVLEDRVQELSADLPAVASVTEALPEARFPNFKGIMAAKKKPIETLSLTDIEVDSDHTGTARSIMLSVSEKPARAAGVTVVDEGDGGEQLAAYLVENKLVASG